MLEIACLGEALDRSCRRDVTNRQKLKRWTESQKTPFTPSVYVECMFSRDATRALLLPSYVCAGGTPKNFHEP